MEPKWKLIYSQFQKISPVPDDEWEAFQAICSHKFIAKDDHFIRAGEHTEWIGICVSGLFRFYYTTPSGDEFNKNFSSKHDFITSYSSLLQNTPSFFSIQSLMDSELIIFRNEDFQSLYSRHPCWDRLGRIVIEQLYVKKEIRERELLTLSAEARYLLFLERYGHLTSYIPQYHMLLTLGSHQLL